MPVRAVLGEWARTEVRWGTGGWVCCVTVAVFAVVVAGGIDSGGFFIVATGGVPGTREMRPGLSATRVLVRVTWVGAASSGDVGVAGVAVSSSRYGTSSGVPLGEVGEEGFSAAHGGGVGHEDTDGECGDVGVSGGERIGQRNDAGFSGCVVRHDPGQHEVVEGG